MTSRSPERARVGEVIRTRRRELGISQEAMSKRVAMSYAGYRPWERGERDMSSEDLVKWADALELTRAELARRIGLSDVSISSIYAAEIEDLIAQIPDPATAEEARETVRMILRLASRPAAPPASRT